MANRRKNPRTWLREMWEMVDEEGVQIERWTVMGRSPGMPRAEGVATVHRSQVKDLATLTSRISSEGDGSDHHHVQLKAWMGGEKKNPVSTCMWSDPGDGEEEDDSSIPASERVMAQLLRFNQRLHDTALSTLEGTIGGLNDRLASLEAENKRLVMEGVEVRAEIGVALDNSVERQAKAKGLDALTSGVQAVMSGIQYRLMGGNPDADSREATLVSTLENLGKSFTEEELVKLTEVLGDHRGYVMLNLMNDPKKIAETLSGKEAAQEAALALRTKEEEAKTG